MACIREALYGVVVQTYDAAGKPIAMKRMNLQAMQQRRALRSGQRIMENGFQEIEIARRLQHAVHDHVVHILDVETSATECRILMKLYSNGELYPFIQQGRCSQAQLIRIFQDIVHGLNHLHSLNIAHLDLSLENVLLDDQLRASICDFGLAEMNGSHCHGGRGKPLYMAPELYRRKSFSGFQADMWSLGILLFAMFTGCFPHQCAHDGDEHFQVLAKRGLPHLIRQWRLSISPIVVDLLNRLLVCDPDERVTMDELISHALIRVPSTSRVSWLTPHLPCHQCLKIVGVGHRKRVCCKRLLCMTCFSEHQCTP